MTGQQQGGSVGPRDAGLTRRTQQRGRAETRPGRLRPAELQVGRLPAAPLRPHAEAARRPSVNTAEPGPRARPYEGVRVSLTGARRGAEGARLPGPWAPTRPGDSPAAPGDAPPARGWARLVRPPAPLRPDPGPHRHASGRPRPAPAPARLLRSPGCQPFRSRGRQPARQLRRV